MLVDLDRFKEVNDALGHAYGDQLLKLVGPRLLAVLRKGDMLARVAGDEFAVLLPAIDDPADRLGRGGTGARSTLRTLNLVLAKAFVEQTGRTLGANKPRESDDERPVWSLAEARRFGDHVREDRLYPLWRLLLVSGLRRGELCGLRCGDLEPRQGTLTVRRQLVVEDPGSRFE